MGRLIGFDHACRQVPEGLVYRIDQKHTLLLITEHNLGSHTFTSLETVTLGQLLTPCLGVTYVQGFLSFHVITHALPIQQRDALEPPRPSSPQPVATP